MTVQSLDELGLPYRAVHDHILLLTPLPAKITKGGLVLPDQAQKPYGYGYVFAVGPEVKTVAPGDWIIFEPAHAKPVMFDDPNQTMFTVVVEAGVYIGLSTKVAEAVGMQKPQMDVIDVLSRTKQTAVGMTEPVLQKA